MMQLQYEIEYHDPEKIMDYGQDSSAKWLRSSHERNIADCYEKESERKLMHGRRYWRDEYYETVLDKIRIRLPQKMFENESCFILLPETSHMEHLHNAINDLPYMVRVFTNASEVDNKSSTAMPMSARHVKTSEGASEPTAHVLENLADDCGLPREYASKIRDSLEDASRFISDKGAKYSILHELFTDPEFPDWKMIKVTFKIDTESSHAAHDELKDQIYEIVSSKLTDHILENIIIKFDRP